MITKDLRQKVLSLAIRGKLVEQDPNDEPASELLKRVNPFLEPIAEDVPFDVPQGWCWCKLGDVCLFENGFAFKSTDYKKEGTPIVRISDIVNNRVELSKCVYYQGTVDKRFCISKGDLLIALSGATTGKMGVYMSDEKAYLNQRVGNLKIKSTDVLSYEYRNIYMQSLVDKILYNAYGAAQPNISGNTICEMLIPLPPLAEQERIVSKLEELLASIDTIERAQGDLDDIKHWLRSKLLSLAVSGKLVKQDPNDEAAITLLKSIDPYFTPPQYDETLPDGWCWCKLGDVFSHCSGKALNKSNRAGTLKPYITTSNLYWNYFVLDDLKQMYYTDEELEKCTAIKGDLLVCEGGDIGRAAIWNYDEPICLQNHIHKLRARIPLCTLFFYYVLYLYKHTGRIGGKGIGIQGLSSKALHNIILPLPPLAEQQRIVSKLEELFAELDKL